MVWWFFSFARPSPSSWLWSPSRRWGASSRARERRFASRRKIWFQVVSSGGFSGFRWRIYGLLYGIDGLSMGVLSEFSKGFEGGFNWHLYLGSGYDVHLGEAGKRNLDTWITSHYKVFRWSKQRTCRGPCFLPGFLLVHAAQCHEPKVVKKPCFQKNETIWGPWSPYWAGMFFLSLISIKTTAVSRSSCFSKLTGEGRQGDEIGGDEPFGTGREADRFGDQRWLDCRTESDFGFSGDGGCTWGLGWVSEGRGRFSLELIEESRSWHGRERFVAASFPCHCSLKAWGSGAVRLHLKCLKSFGRTSEEAAV